MGNKKLNITIIGGSIAGLLHAIALKAAGHNVQILEQKKEIELHSDKGISLGSFFQQFLRKYRSSSTTLVERTIKNTGCVTFNQDGSVKSTEDLPLLCADVVTSTWNTVHRILMQDLQANTYDYGSVVLRTGTRVTDVQEDRGRMVVTYSTVPHGKNEACEADLVIAADGARSIVRSRVLQDIKPVDAGCVAWRGDISAQQCPAELDCALEGRFCFVPMPESGSYIILQVAKRRLHGDLLTTDRYAKPSNEKIEDCSGGRLVEWCWYDRCVDPLKYFETTSGRSAHHNVASCITDSDAWKNRIESPGARIPEWIKPWIEDCAAPLLCQVTSVESKKCVFFDGKVVLVGEAMCQPPPFSGMSCNIAAKSAIEMGKLMSHDSSSDDWKDWEKMVQDLAKSTMEISKAVGERYMTSLASGESIVSQDR